jgi:hypothetical protein
MSFSALLRGGLGERLHGGGARGAGGAGGGSADAATALARRATAIVDVLEQVRP